MCICYKFIYNIYKHAHTYIFIPIHSIHIGSIHMIKFITRWVQTTVFLKNKNHIYKLFFYLWSLLHQLQLKPIWEDTQGPQPLNCRHAKKQERTDSWRLINSVGRERETTYLKVSPPTPVHIQGQDTHAWQTQLELHSEQNSYKSTYCQTWCFPHFTILNNLLGSGVISTAEMLVIFDICSSTRWYS